MIISPAIMPLDRTKLIHRYRTNRKRTAGLFAKIGKAMYEQPLELRHPFIFYLGHIPAFNFNTLAKRAYNIPSTNEKFDTLFRRGIDPEDAQGARTSRDLWPGIDQVEAYATNIDSLIESLLAEATLEDERNPYLTRAQAVYTILEHEEMHQETLLYILNRLDHVRCTSQPAPPAATAPSRRMRIPQGRVTLGADPDSIPFGWDNEFQIFETDVAAFELETLPITNDQYRIFVESGAAPPASWMPTPDGWLQRTLQGIIPLQGSWPVYVSFEAANAYAASVGARIMTEAEYHRAAFGEPGGNERKMPWGNDLFSKSYGNLGFRRFDPEPVGLSPQGASAWGIQELVGNGWELTSTEFAPFPGFTPMASYPEYSADFFDGKHLVIKGASPITATTLLRPSLRNWYRREYPYAFTKFRLAYDV